ncbi:MAG TPA: NUDIX hydrolase [Solirubrobacteraceae bacterium]|jgi:ADP-ribose pyrophosphatase
MSSRFERTSTETVYEGKTLRVRVDEYRHEDGGEVKREIVEREGSVGMVAHDGERVYLVRQPREAVGSPDLLEIPAGRLDKEGEPALDAAKRELVEEIGKAAEEWEEVATYYSSVGFSDEEVVIYLATGLTDASPDEDPGENERIEIVTHPLAELDALIAEVRDAKTLIGLLELSRRLAA